MPRYDAAAVTSFSAALLRNAGLDAGHADCLASTLIAADLLGHSSHGIGLLGRNIEEVRTGKTARTGEPTIVKDGGGTLLIDGGMLPGPVVMHRALDIALDRLPAYGTVTAVVRRSAHIACLGAYLERATGRGKLLLIASSNPWAQIVAPHGGRRPVYSPNPIAFGIPTNGEPILIDLSLSTVAHNVCREYRARGEKLPGEYLIDREGRPSADPALMFADPPGAIMPLGGIDLGYKGFALGLIVEALTAGLGGFGRQDAPATSSNSVLIYLVDPEAFGSGEFLKREAEHLASACTAAGEDVRLPGQRAIAHRRAALADGLSLDPKVMAVLSDLANAAGIAVPEPLKP